MRSLAPVVLALALAPTSTQPSTSDPAALEKVLLEEMRDSHTPGASIAVVSGDQILLLKGLGVASIETGDPVRPDTLFRLGSTTKMFTGLAAAILVGEGRLAFDAPAGRSTPLKSPIAELRLDALLTHTAGLIQEGAANGSHDDDALGARVKGWGEEHVFAPAGDVYSYSSPGYWLAGHLIEAAAGKPFADVVAERILQPAGMTRSTFRPLVAFTYPTAQDHAVRNRVPQVIRPFPDDSSTWPGGSLFSNARELARFTIALMNQGRIDGRQVLPEAAVRELMTRHADSLGGCGYTYGLSECDRGGVRILSHYGFRSGSGSVVAMAPAKRVAVVVLANRAGAIMARTEAAALRMLAGVRDDASDAPAPLSPVAEDRARRLVGTYVNGPDVLTLSLRGSELRYRYGSNANQTVRSAGPDEIVVLDSQGREEQRFVVATGRRTGAQYLSDGTAAFRRTDPR